MNSEQVEFRKWPSIPRDVGERVLITEKIDGTNACVVIQDGEVVAVQSRNRFITPEDDNYGFAQWVEDNKENLKELGDGYHYGEWAGLGIQKNPYHLPSKQWFLFNANRWRDSPSCCKVVPIVYEGEYDSATVNECMQALKDTGSRVGVGDGYEGYVEGVVAFYTKTRRLVKTTYNHNRGKWDEHNTSEG